MKEVLSILQFYAERNHIKEVPWFPSATYHQRCSKLFEEGYRKYDSNKYTCQDIWIEQGNLAKQFLENL